MLVPAIPSNRMHPGGELSGSQFTHLPAIGGVHAEPDPCETSERKPDHRRGIERTWDGRYPMIEKSWRANWSRIIPFFPYSEDIRKVIYTTNAIESINHSLRKVTKNRSCFPSDEAALKLLYMALKHITKRWTMPIRDWNLALHQLSIRFEGRVQM